MRKFIRKVLIPIIVITLIFSGIPAAEAVSPDKITAPSAILIEAETGKVLYDKDSHQSSGEKNHRGDQYDDQHLMFFIFFHLSTSYTILIPPWYSKMQIIF